METNNYIYINGKAKAKDEWVHEVTCPYHFLQLQSYGDFHSISYTDNK